MKTLLYHGGLGKIEVFNEDFGGETTCDNEHGAFYFSNIKEVAIDYSLQAFNRRYQDNIESLVLDGILQDEPNTENDDYGFVEELAHNNINVVEASITMNNPFTIDANYKNLRELEEIFNIQNAIGFIKGRDIDEIPKQFMELVEFDEDYEECSDIPEFDGIIIKNVIDDIGDLSCVFQDVYIAVSPYQINILRYITE
jgi:hypothetical protein